ncbi:MAG: phosphoribosyl-AMP cyclohydrolase [Hyphomicrobium sp.]
MTKTFAPRTTANDIESGDTFQPKFDGDGLIPAIVTDAGSGAVLMFAFMNDEALRLTLETGFAHFWSRSRKALWKKGEESGNLLKIGEVKTDCDQDVLWLTVSVAGDGVACHTGAVSCFYRTLTAAPDAPGGVRLVNAAMRDKRAKS